ncbi:DUF7344 domain-containing protein [Haloarcula marina]|uniref:DUF7344 domain-containing protein n=1 Tax=Haloarcula marina TaxID=2961574 RepID=UPI0020B728D9|nr:hypothetical protein [Halomicroarcula marina]
MSTQDQTPIEKDQTPIESDLDESTSETAAVDAEAQDQEAETQATETDLSLDLIFEILKNSRRREVLHYLRDHEEGERVSLGELAEHVAAIENDTTTEALTSSERKRVYVGLYQCHLPKMDDMGVVEFNQNRGHVELAPAAEQLTEYLDRPAESARVPWHRYYAVISGIGVAVLGLAVGLGLAQSVLLLMVGLVVATFAFCSGTHWYVESQTEE